MNYPDQDRINEEHQDHHQQQPQQRLRPQQDQQLIGNHNQQSEGTFPSRGYSLPYASGQDQQQQAINMSTAMPVMLPSDYGGQGRRRQQQQQQQQPQHPYPTPHAHVNVNVNAQYTQQSGPAGAAGYPPPPQQQQQPLPQPYPPPPSNQYAQGPTPSRHQGYPTQSFAQQYFNQVANQAEAALQAQAQAEAALQAQAQAEAALQAQAQAQIPQQHMAMPMQNPHVNVRQVTSRNPSERPIVRLSVALIETYKRINDEYYRDPSNMPRPTRRPEPGSRGGVRNNGWDDDNYDYIIRRGELLGGRYEIQERIGRGSFGQVVKAYDTLKKKPVAIKIIKSKKPFLDQAATEIEILTHLNQRDPDDQYNIVRLLSTFMHRGHQCLVFEMLSLNLYELLKNTQFEGVSLNLIRKFAKQILKSLKFLSFEEVDIIHCDLKPENILLRHPKRSGVKVIDFGSSCRSNNQMYSYIQSRFYRSPEVLLGLPYSVAIDMWSLGCILVEMHTGEPLFSGQDQVDQVQKIVRILGMIPDDMIEAMEDEKRNDYHLELERTPENNWFLGPRPNQNERIVPSVNPRQSLKSIIQKREPTSEPEITQYRDFTDLIYKMLAYRPEQRILPNDALHHPFIDPDTE